MTAVTSEIVLKCKSLLIQITHSQERESQLKEEKRVEEFSLKKGERCVLLSVSNIAEIISDLNIGTLRFQKALSFINAKSNNRYHYLLLIYLSLMQKATTDITICC